MIEISNLTKTFDGFTALNDLNLSVKKGSIYGLVGVNGSGKTTAIKHITGLYRPCAGEVKIAQTPVYDNAAIKEKVGYIPDDLYFFPHYTMKMLRAFYRGMYPAWNDERFTILTNLFGLDVKRRVGKFSKGMQKQVAFVFVMSTMPDVLVLDEPIDGLDPIVRKEILQRIIDDVAARELTVLVSSHNLKEMEGLCDAVGIIKKGHMAVERDIDDLKSDVHKIQIALPQISPTSSGDITPDQNNLNSGDSRTQQIGLDILHHEQRGSIEMLVVRGSEAEVSAKIKSLNPLVYDHLPLTLEEIFVYEGGGGQ